MLQYIIAGLALGSIYAIASASLLVTYVSTGVLNLSFAGIAYFVARFYYYLNSQHGWPSYGAGLLVILGAGPLLGAFLYFSVFRHLQDKSTLIKLVATIGLLVAVPNAADLLFGPQGSSSVPGLASPNDRSYHIFGTAVDTDQIIIYGFLLFIAIAGTAVLRLTDVGLKVRAVVDSEAMSALSGTSPRRVALGVWVVSVTLAGLAGILVAPSQGLLVGSPTSGGMIALMTAALAVVIVSRFRSLAGAVLGSLAMGVVTDVIQKYLPENSALTSAIVVCIPFGFLLVALIFYLVRFGSLREEIGGKAMGHVDAAIRPASAATEYSSGETARGTRFTMGLSAIPLVVVAVLPVIFSGNGYWLGLVVAGFCYAIAFLSFTLVTGEGGMLWLCQIIFTGIGALAVGQFATMWHVPVLLAVLLGGIIAAVAGAIIGLLTIRLGDLYVAIVTLTFGALIEGLVFTLNRFLNGGVGVLVGRPSFAGSDMTLGYVALIVFAILALLTVNLRRSTSGLALRAVRDSQTAASTLGLSLVQVKMIVSAIAAFVAAIGGGFLAMYTNLAQPQNYDMFGGLVWLAVVVAWGVRSITGALLAALSFTLLPGVFESYIPARWGTIPSLLFGLGAVFVVQHPEGVVAQYARQFRQVVAGLTDRRTRAAREQADPVTAAATAAQADMGSSR
jgi:branched-chain amino acid transport system permease protein